MNKASTSLLVRQHHHQSRCISNNIQCCSSISIPPRRRLHTTRRTASSSSSIQKVDAANAAIKQAFDSPPPVFSLLQSFQHPNNTSGRFGYDALHKPEDFILLSQRTQRRAKAVVERIIDYAKSTTPLSSSSNKHKRKDKQVESSSSNTTKHIQYSHSHESQIRDLLIQVKQVDRLSDLLCSVIDLAELVRNLDPNSEWIKHAEVAYQELCYYMNQLNTHVDLYKVGFSLSDTDSRFATSSENDLRGRTDRDKLLIFVLLYRQFPQSLRYINFNRRSKESMTQ